ncbi:uncharacterized protein N7525_001315 [Penicillium rubens]|nr:uncharacterized protein N7525_001315 [Penicillium rubens]KAJ5843574.1 hypothetical protein N7525_001315 [Penicillium rubens]
MASNPTDIEGLALSSNLPDTVPDLLQTVASHGKDLIAQDPEARLKLPEAARSLTYALETPEKPLFDTAGPRLTGTAFNQSTSYAALETAVDINLFSALGTDDKPKTVAELAEATSVDPILLGRLMKHLAAIGTISETGYNEYCPTGFSKVLTVERYSDAFPLMTRRFTKGIMVLPAFLKKNNYQNPTSPTDTAFQMGYETDMGFFGHVQQEPLTAKQFNNHMSVYAQGRVRWMDPGFYPIQEQLIDGVMIGEDDVLLVDVGGSFGHDLSGFHRKWPGLPGRLVLQDLPEVVASVKDLHPSIEVTSHDFFTEQPVRGARAYYMHSVLHDWPDELCRKILANIVAAMRPGYSKVLVNENVIPDTGAYWETTSLDLIMMEIGSGERTERQWHALLESAGLKIIKIWTAQRGVESLIECELA